MFMKITFNYLFRNALLNMVMNVMIWEEHELKINRIINPLIFQKVIKFSPRYYCFIIFILD